MEWTGKLLGALLGFVITRRPIGVLLGMILGHLFDQYAAGERAGAASGHGGRARTFFRAAFTIMGHVAKSDGRVSEQDIAAARGSSGSSASASADTRSAHGVLTRRASSRISMPRLLLDELAIAVPRRRKCCACSCEIQMRAALVGRWPCGRDARDALGASAAALGIGR